MPGPVLRFDPGLARPALVLMLLPFPDFGDGAAGGIDFVFEGAAGVIETREVLRCGVEEEHAAITDGAGGSEFAQARSCPGDDLTIWRHDQALSLATDGTVWTDDGGIGPIPEVATPNMVPLSSNETSAVGGSVESTRLTSLLPLVSPILSPIMHAPLLSRGVK
jgi:hypothetical protein